MMIKKIPFFLTLLAMTGGVFIAILFGVNEEIFKDRIKQGLELNPKIQQILDPSEKASKMTSEADKNWRYYQRFHFHSTGIGAMMMGILLFLSRLKAPSRHKLTAAYLVSVGGFLYPFVWLFAGIYGPEMGRNEAKEAFAIFGYMGGVFLIGTIFSMILALRYDFQEA